MSCTSEGFENPHWVRCPCEGCDGALVDDGPNKADTRTFLQCGTCRCTYVVPRKADRRTVT